MSEAQSQCRRRQIPTALYDLPEFQALNVEAREAYFHIQINSYSTGLQVYKASVAALAADRRVPEANQYRHMCMLQDAGLIDFDPERHVVFVPRALAWAKPNNPNTLASLLKIWVEIPPSRVKERARNEILELAREWGPNFSDLAEQVLGRGAYVDNHDTAVPHPNEAYQPGLDLERGQLSEETPSASADARPGEEQVAHAGPAAGPDAAGERERTPRRVTPINDASRSQSDSADRSAAGPSKPVRASLRDNREPFEYGRRGKGGAKVVLRGEAAERFAQFWAAFNLKQDRRACAEVWAQIEDEESGIDDDLMQTIVSAAKAEADARPALIANNGRPKYPQGWLTEARWESYAEGGGTPAATGPVNAGEARSQRNQKVAEKAAAEIMARDEERVVNADDERVVEGM